MIDAFEKESKLHERRAERQRQMRLMEEAASGLPLSSSNGATGSSVYSDNNNLVLGLPPTMADMEAANNNFAIDDNITDDEDAGPPSVFTASANLWRSQKESMKLDAEKLGFITGANYNDSNSGSDVDSSTATPKSRGGSWLKRSFNKEHTESRELILMASR